MPAGVLPVDLPPADLTPELADQLLTTKADGPKKLGIDPESEQAIFLKIGPFGPYVQLGEDDPNSKKKPKRASLLKGMDAGEVDLDTALALLSLPRTLGEHPETGKPVQASVGRFGPYVVHDGVYVNLRGGDNVLEIELERGLELLAAKANGGGGGRGSAKSVLKELGEHPDGGPVQVLAGRYGPYVSRGKVNVTLPKGVEPDAVTLEMALGWLAEKAAKSPTKKPAAKKTAPAAGNGASSSAPARKTTAATAKPRTTAKTKAKSPAGKTVAKKTPVKKAAPGAKAGAKTMK